MIRPRFKAMLRIALLPLFVGSPMLRKLVARWKALGPVLALAVACALVLHAALAAELAPVGHAHDYLVVAPVAQASVHPSPRHHRQDTSAALKVCAGYCSLAWILSPAEPLAQAGRPVHVPTCERAPAVSWLVTGTPPPRLAL